MDDNFDDLIGPAPAYVSPNLHTNGGRREGSGRKKKVVMDATQKTHVEYVKFRAKNEENKANLAELAYRVKSGSYLPREEIQQAAAKAYATIAQTLRSIPDNLERRLGITPAVAEAVGNMIDDMLGDLSEDLEQMYRENTT